MVLTIAAFLIKYLVKHRMDKDIEAFKLTLSATAERELAVLRANLNQAEFEHQIRFSKLHDRRAEVIAQLYSYLVDLYDAGESFLNKFQSSRDDHPKKLEALSNALKTALHYFQRHRLYFPEATCARIDAFFSKVTDIASNLSYHVSIRADQRDLRQMSLDWNEAWNDFEKQVPELRRALEEEFRAILGGK